MRRNLDQGKHLSPQQRREAKEGQYPQQRREAKEDSGKIDSGDLDSVQLDTTHDVRDDIHPFARG
ncbi:hypothetical protein PGQ11_002680 [Apiospora arundinis]|uniref:Uncharacterized protein n=1 Tax=Apiospora arundinis TaxID=335852 RepID=A0ABR2JIY9_9PEZI